MEAQGSCHGPRERLLLRGEARLSDAECIALLLRTGCPGRSAEQIASDLLHRFGGLSGLAVAEVREVATVSGIGTARALALQAAFGLARRLAEARLTPGMPVRSGGDVARVVREATRGLGRESFWSLSLDIRHRVLGLRQVSLGSLGNAPVHPREVFAPLIRERAAALVVAHNHPSGDPSPSAEDRLVTERLRQVGELCGIELLDHVVVGDLRYFSFADEVEREIT
ncbi:MAG: DNA repair protein RadC [Planctomycetota bacterium]